MAATEVPFGLAEVKLAAPPHRPGTVPKTAVIDQLSAGDASFATVVAPAGYGKTTLLANWAAADPRRFAWVALDRRDDDAMVFLRYMTAAINSVEPVQPEVLDALSGPGGSSWATRVPYVGRALASLDEPIVLVLDDLHHVSNPSCLDALSALFDYVPAGSQIAVASREEPPVPLARWRVLGRLHEFGTADLRLSDEEAGLLLEAAGLELQAEEVSELTERTEGWPAGLYFAALSMKTGAAPAMSPDSFTGDDRFVSEFFREELLSRLPAAESQFLTHSSVLERMSGGLCDSVLQTTGSAKKLATLERTNGFVVPLDRRGEWFRYHHLFGELLQRELEHSEPELMAELNMRAMTWCLDNGLPEAAIHYAHAAGETDTVAELVDALGLTLYYDGRMETVEEWLRWFGEDDLVQYPALLVFGAWFRAMTGRPADAERWLALAEGATSKIPLSDGSATIEPWAANLRAYMMRGGVEQALADAELALDQFAPNSGWIPVAHQIQGVALSLLGDNERAMESWLATVELGLAAGTYDDVFTAQAELSLLAARRGAWTRAAAHARAAQALVEESGLGDYSPASIVHMATARVAIHEGRHDDARAALARAHRLRPMLDHAIPWLTVQVGLELTRAHLALGDASAARTVFAETERVLEVRPNLGYLVEDAQELRDRLAATSGSIGAWAMSLTGAELRLLPVPRHASHRP